MTKVPRYVTLTGASFRKQLRKSGKERWTDEVFSVCLELDPFLFHLPIITSAISNSETHTHTTSAMDVSVASHLEAAVN
jgi:hypothetical protein